MRSQILSLVSHELRMPLTVIKSSAQILRGTGQQDERQQLFIEKIERQSERLGHLVDDLISLALLRARPEIQQVGEFDLMALTEEMVTELQGVAAERKLRLSLVRPEGTARISGDRILIGRALHHLVANAVKFSPPGGEVRMEAENRTGEGVSVSVYDPGRACLQKCVSAPLSLLPRSKTPSTATSRARYRLDSGERSCPGPRWEAPEKEREEFL